MISACYICKLDVVWSFVSFYSYLLSICLLETLKISLSMHRISVFFNHKTIKYTRMIDESSYLNSKIITKFFLYDTISLEIPGFFGTIYYFLLQHNLKIKNVIQILNRHVFCVAADSGKSDNSNLQSYHITHQTRCLPTFMKI